MGISRILKTMVALASSLTLLGVNVVLLDDYSTASDTPTTVTMAPVTSPVLENIAAPGAVTQDPYQAQYQTPIVAGQPSQTQANQGVN